MSIGPRKERLHEIAKVLWEHWHPIGVNPGVVYGADAPNVWTDEYDSYAPSVAALLRAWADVDRLANHLSQLTKTNIGLEPDQTRDAAVAAVLIDHMKMRI